MSKPFSEGDYRAVITVILLFVPGAIAICGMYLGWTTTEILAIMAFFGSLLTAAITYYFIGKTSERSRQTPPWQLWSLEKSSLSVHESVRAVKWPTRYPSGEKHLQPSADLCFFSRFFM